MSLDGADNDVSMAAENLLRQDSSNELQNGYRKEDELKRTEVCTLKNTVDQAAKDENRLSSFRG